MCVADGAEPSGKVVIQSRPPALELTPEAKRLSASPYFSAWRDAFEDRHYFSLIYNPVAGSGDATLSVGAIATVENGATNLAVVISTSAVLVDPKLELSVDDALISLEVTSDALKRGKDDDLVIFPCAEDVLERIANARSVTAKIVAVNSTKAHRVIRREFSKPNIGRFRVFLDVFIAGKNMNVQAAKASAQSEAARIKAIEGTKMRIHGKVLQRVDRGLLVESGLESHLAMERFVVQSGGIPVGPPGPTKDVTGLTVYSNLCLLEDHPDYRTLVDGDRISIVAYPTETYTYKAVNGGTRTVQLFTADRSKVPKAVLPTTMEKLLKAHY